MEHVIGLFIIRKISIPLGLLIDYFRLRKAKKQKRVGIENILFPAVLLFLVFSYTYRFDFDLYDKIMVFFIFPLYFVYQSVIFFKNRVSKKENYKYILLLLFFIGTQVLYIVSV